MRTLLLVVLLSACGGLGPDPRPTVPEPQTSLVERSLDATVRLEDEGHIYCSGVLTRGFVLTAAHCVDDKRLPATVKFSLRQSRDTYEAAVVAFDEEADWAVLSPLAVLPEHAEASVSSYDPAAGDRVVTVGHPLGIEYFITVGVASGVRTTWGNMDWLITSAPIMYGNSGGPVFNEYGEIVGITSWLAVARGQAVGHIAGSVPTYKLRAAVAGRSLRLPQPNQH